MTCVVLCYHRVLPPGVGGPLAECQRRRGTVVSLATFERQMEDAARLWVPIALDEFVAALEGRGSLPERACLVTFDDGYRDFAEHALPVLQRRSMPSVLFVTAAQVVEPQALAPADVWYSIVAGAPGTAVEGSGVAEKREYDMAPPTRQVELQQRLARRLGTTERLTLLAAELYLNESELAALARRGVELGSHGASHYAFTALADSDLQSNLVASRELLQRLAPQSPAAISYPYGRVDERVRRATAQSGYRAGFTVRPYDGKPDEDALLVKRSCVPDRREALRELAAGERMGI